MIFGVTQLNRRHWRELIFKDDADYQRFFVGLMAPEIPAARANGTVSPSDMPITMSFTVSPPRKCSSR